MLTRRDISTERKTKIMDRDGWKCYICGDKSCALEVHHVVPVFLGGSNDDTNLVSLCHGCHLAIHREDIEKCVENAVRTCLIEQQKQKRTSFK